MTTSRISDIKKIQQLGLKAEIAFVIAMSVDQLTNNEVIAVYDGLPEPIFSVVVDTQTSEDKLDDIITSVINFYQKRGSNWSWIIGPLSSPQPPILERHLKHHNLSKTESYPGMYFNLEHDIPVSPSIGLDIHEVDAADTLDIWIKPVSAAFPPAKTAERVFEF